ncbi:hypothetical protein SS50377_22066 [Spironucleus salmonicida]|uniref:Uncharacterized protein n=1 Tax=Spironucleus salmonicida TaxID=348837 RepID=V6LM56_9EUKA|nr:hypothetical protein SS50377_22066 [Spironucleus salmonicida]|eukprot:EST45772.1 Hypothetical protein SS50377_14343 [Spironucleus salmonicida]
MEKGQVSIKDLPVVKQSRAYGSNRNVDNFHYNERYSLNRHEYSSGRRMLPENIGQNKRQYKERDRLGNNQHLSMDKPVKTLETKQADENNKFVKGKLVQVHSITKDVYLFLTQSGLLSISTNNHQFVISTFVTIFQFDDIEQIVTYKRRNIIFQSKLMKVGENYIQSEIQTQDQIIFSQNFHGFKVLQEKQYFYFTNKEIELTQFVPINVSRYYIQNNFLVVLNNTEFCIINYLLDRLVIHGPYIFKSEKQLYGVVAIFTPMGLKLKIMTDCKNVFFEDFN